MPIPDEIRADRPFVPVLLNGSKTGWSAAARRIAGVNPRQRRLVIPLALAGLLIIVIIASVL